MSPILFWPFAVMTLVFGIAVIANRNPVASALSLVVCFLGLAALFAGLDAFFVGVIQILVYAGAVMVLFLFIIMLLDLKVEVRRKINPLAYAGGSAVALLFAAELWLVLKRFRPGHSGFPALPTAAKIDDVRAIGTTLFSTHNLPFQIVGVLILVATIGVVILSKRELK
jgi:NADH-quinone oxidoreductase subunit J